MRKILHLLSALVLVVAALPTATAGAASGTPPVPGACARGTLASGALSLICVPGSGWNGDLVLFAHGYVAYDQPLDFYNLTLPDGTYLPTLVQGLGYAFATTSYRENGLAILPALTDLRELIAAFPGVAGASPKHTYLTGISEGGLVATLFAERSPNLISGALAACGPIGSFRGQIDYFGNFRVLFDELFPGVIPGSPVDIPPSVIDNWATTYQTAAILSLAADPSAAARLISDSHAAIDPAEPGLTTIATAVELLWYNVFATNDAAAKLGGSPYDNRSSIPRDLLDDLRLDLKVERYSGSPVALANVAHDETTGHLTIPLVTLHTTEDPIIPYWQEALYRAKAHPTGKGRLTQLPVDAYGHCAFTTPQMLRAWDTLVRQVTGHGLPRYNRPKGA